MKKHMILLCAAASMFALGGCGLNDKLQSLKDSLDRVDSTTEARVSGEKPEETDSEADNKKDIDNSAESKTETDTTDKSSDDKESGGKQGDGDSKATEKFDEILRTAYNDGILDMCKEHFMSYRNGVWGDAGIADTYNASDTDYYFSICDIDGDEKDELLLAWGDWCDWEMHEKFIDIMKYDAASDSVEHEGVVIAKKQYSEDSSRKWMDGVTFYDNGTILSDYTYGMIAGQCLYTYEYDSSKDVYSGISGNEIIKDYSNRAGALWDKTQEVYRYNNDVNFPDELDKDGDGKLYCPGVGECNIEDENSNWVDLGDLGLNLPDDYQEHTLAVTWYRLGDYVQNGDKIEYKKDMETVYSEEIESYRRYVANKASESDKNEFSIYDGIAYAETDLNSDGVPELIVGLSNTYGPYDPNDEYQSFDAIRIYTWKNDSLRLVYCSNIPYVTMANKYVVTDNEIRRLAGSGTGFALYEFYQLPENSTVLHMTEAIKHQEQLDENGSKILFYHTEGDYNLEDWQEISEDEYNQILDRVDDKKIAYEYMYLN